MYSRTQALIGEKALEKIKKSCICVFGLGGVGSYVVESLVRAGIGTLIIIDFAKIDITNINRQIIALTSTIGEYKTIVTEKRVKDINNSINVVTFNEFVDENNIESMLKDKKIDYIVDAIDNVNSKIAIIKYAKTHNISIISSMGTGNKVNPSLFEIVDITKTSVCPLARKIRKQIKSLDIKNLDVLYSKEVPEKNDETIKVPASISFVPSVAGLLLSGYIINKLIKM